MTSKAFIFISVVEEIINKHGFGSNKMVEELYTRNPEGWMRNTGHTKDEYYKESIYAQDLEELIELGYLRTYETANSYTKHYSRVSSKTSFTSKNYIGVTKEGWEIANKYLALERV